MLAITIGGLWLCLWRRRWRLLGIVPIVLGAATVLTERPPDILLSPDAKVLGVRARDGSYLFSTSRPGRLVEETWSRRGGVEGGAAWPRSGASPDGSLVCDRLGCIYAAAGRKVALVLDGAALEEDCGADLVVSLVPARRSCRRRTALIDRFDAWRKGGHAIWIDPGAIRIETVDGRRGGRPWVPRRAAADDQ
jgi:competence protein ComEC